MMRVLSVSSSRADVGILHPVWAALIETGQVDLHVFFTGMHLASEAVDQTGSVPVGATVHRGGSDLGGTDGILAAEAMAHIGSAAAKVLGATNPDVLVVVGDRLDMVPTAMAALPMGVPIVHLHGGEITEGAMDDCVRRALSQISDRHCVAHEEARRNLVSMGIDNTKITVTGAPGLDTLRSAATIDAVEFAQTFSLPVGEPFRLVTVHPETKAADPLAPLNAVLEALAARPGPVLFTAPNSDPGGVEARERILDFCSRLDGAIFVETLGALYPSALRNAAIMLGNSSSGIIEAGLFGLPVLDIGERQTGRIYGHNVQRLPAVSDLIIAALDGLGRNPKRCSLGTPYGDGASSRKLATVVIETVKGSK
ncbi:UDP-N-acetylglucosamine 2-epimerase [Roseobacter sp. HKCCD7870]|uniref:UDP-N-acetylglucosamine 2-epimerase n=1 Tax=Roseobacter sp. HKCCD7870 TaxID=3120343 RepID=UPI0030EC80AC